METQTVTTDNLAQDNGQVTLEQMLQDMQVENLPKGLQAKLERKRKLEEMLVSLEIDVTQRVERVKTGGGRRPGKSHPLAKSPTRLAFNAFFKAMDTLNFSIISNAFAQASEDLKDDTSLNERQLVYDYLVGEFKDRALKENEEAMAQGRKNASSFTNAKKGGVKAKAK